MEKKKKMSQVGYKRGGAERNFGDTLRIPKRAVFKHIDAKFLAKFNQINATICEKITYDG